MFDLIIHGEIEHGLSLTVKSVLDRMVGETVSVLVNSPGGDAMEGAAVMSQFQRHGKVEVTIEGVCASAASLLVMGAARIVMARTAMMMIHDPSCYAEGTRKDLRKMADALDKMAETYAAGYARRSGQTKETVLQWMDVETWFSAEDALAHGFCDAVEEATGAPVAAMFDYTRFHNAPQRLVALARNNGWATASPDETDRSLEMLDHNGRKAPSAQLQARVLASMRSKGNTAANSEMLAAFFPLMVEGVDPATLAAMFQRILDLVVAAGKTDDLAEIVQQTAAELFGEQDPEDVDDEQTPAQAKAKRLLLSQALEKAVNVVMRLEGSEPLQTIKIRSGAPWNRYQRYGLDEGSTMRQGMIGALVARMTGARQVIGPARQYMGMTFAEMVATHVGHRGSLRTSADRLKVVEMGLGSHSRSDFPGVFENALNKSLQASYQAAPPTYRAIAQDRPFRDFRPHPVVGVGDFPMLERVSEAGEIKYGTISESRESLALLAYAKAFRVTRQMLVDDDLGAIERILAERGRAVAAFEDKTFYNMMLTGANGDGPTLSQTSRQVFNTTDLSKAGTGGALSLTTLSVAWAALRKRKSIDGNELELVPSILLVGPDQELLALQLVETITANESAKVNPFAGKLQVVVTAKITGNAWYLFADPAIAPCFCYGFLEGQEGPRMRMDEPFGQQGMAWSIELDFGVGAIDFRGGFKNAGA